MYACLCVLDKKETQKDYLQNTYTRCLLVQQPEFNWNHYPYMNYTSPAWQQQFQVLNCMVQTIIIYFTSYRQSSILHLPMYSNYCCHKLEMVYTAWLCAWLRPCQPVYPYHTLNKIEHQFTQCPHEFTFFSQSACLSEAVQE